jgi:hypothetical protein
MPTLLSRKAALLFKIESTEGVDAAPAAGTDGILVENCRITLNPNIVETNEVTPSLDPFDPIVGGMSASIEFDVYMKGSGSAVTPPEYGDLLKCCGYAEWIVGPTPGGGPEVCGAGASTVQATLGASASTSSQQYRGMPVNFTGAVTLNTFIWDYSAAKVAKLTDTASANITNTTSWQIPANVTYVPASNVLSSGTIHYFNDGLRYVFLGNRGTVAFNIVSGGPAKASFRFMGMFSSKTDVALPAVTYDVTRPPIWKGGSCTIDSAQAAAGTLNLDTGNQLVMPDNPNALEGFDPAIITLRQLRGSINPKETLVATRNIMADFRSQTKRPIHAKLGITAGNRIGFTIPAALYLNETYGDNNGYRIVDVPFDMTGQDSGMVICSF